MAVNHRKDSIQLIRDTEGINNKDRVRILSPGSSPPGEQTEVTEHALYMELENTPGDDEPYEYEFACCTGRRFIPQRAGDANKLGGKLPEYYAAAANALGKYAHTKSGTVHTLTGTGDNIRFVATADFAAGDTVKVNGTTCTASTMSGDALWDGFFKSGSVVVCYRTGNALNFSGGGLAAAEAAKITPENLKTGVSVTVNGKTVDGTFTADGTASAGDMLTGKTGYVKGQKVTGTMPDRGAVSQALAINGTYTIPAGYHNGNGKVTQSIPTKTAASYKPGTAVQTIKGGQYLSGDQTIQGDAALIAANIKYGAAIFGVSGSFTSDANAAAGEILDGKIGYVKGQRVTGTMPNRGTARHAVSQGINGSGLFYYIEPGYYSEGTGNAWVYRTQEEVASAIGLSADKIAKGQNILGVTGNYAPAPNISTTGSLGGNTTKTIEVSAPNGNVRVSAVYRGADYYNTVRITVRGWNGSSWVQLDNFQQDSGTSTTTPTVEIDKVYSGYSSYQLELYNSTDKGGTGYGVLIGW